MLLPERLLCRLPTCPLPLQLLLRGRKKRLPLRVLLRLQPTLELCQLAAVRIDFLAQHAAYLREA